MGKSVRECWMQWSDIAVPVGAERVPAPLIGPAAFPGGFGVTHQLAGDEPASTLKRHVMFVMNNFGTLGYWNELNRQGRGENLADAKGTWAGIRRLLQAAKVNIEDCYFTNAFVGVLPGDETTSLVGDIPGSRKEPAIRALCIESLRKQVSVVQPRIIAVCGIPAIHLFAEFAPQLRVWQGKRGGVLKFGDLDRCDVAVQLVAGIAETAPLRCVALTHPSLSNSHLRRWKSLRGLAAEVTMLRGYT